MDVEDIISEIEEIWSAVVTPKENSQKEKKGTILAPFNWFPLFVYIHING